MQNEKNLKEYLTCISSIAGSNEVHTNSNSSIFIKQTFNPPANPEHSNKTNRWWYFSDRELYKEKLNSKLQTKGPMEYRFHRKSEGVL